MPSVMKLEELKLLVKEGEGLLVEFKERYSPRIDRDIVAFSNTKGGVVVLGISDDGKMVGQKLSNKLKAEINDLARKCDPPITVKKISQTDKVVVIEIGEGDEKHYSCSEGYFRRLDATTQKMEQREVRTLFRETETVSFEDLSCKELRLGDISIKKVKSFLKEADTSFEVTRANLPPFLTSLGVYEKGKIKNAGALMFASRIEKFLPHAESILGAFKGKDKTNIYDRRDVKDDLLAQFTEAVNFLKKHLNVRSEIRGMKRFDLYEVPLDALREAVVNAIVHRDYAIKGTSSYVRIYDDRVEIENPGGLPAGITKRDFGKSSVRRNPLIADLFHRMGKVERMGSGIERMIDLMREAGLKEPLFEMDTFFRVTFYRDPRYSLKAEGRVGKGGIKVGEKVGVRITDNQAKIMEAMQKDPYISAIKLSEVVGISHRKIEANIAKLREKGLVRRIGPAKGGHWEISKERGR